MERINLEEPRAAGYPVVKRTALGQKFVGAILKAESRDRLKRGDDGTMKPIVKPNGKHAQELVVTCLTLPGTTAPAGLGEDESVPEEGTIVRLILKGKAFGDWIEAKRSLPSGSVAVGDVVTQTTTVAQVYDAQGNASGGEISDQSAVDQARQRGRSIGIYGPLNLEEGKATEWTSKAVEAYKGLDNAIILAEKPTTSEDYEGNGLSSPATQSFKPERPSGFNEQAWDALTDEAKRGVASAMSDQPPF